MFLPLFRDVVTSSLVIVAHFAFQSLGFQWLSGTGVQETTEQEVVDGFHLTINSGLNFSKFPVLSGTAISAFFENSVKEDNLAGEVYPNVPKQFFSRKFPFHSLYTSRGIPKVSEKIFPKTSVPFDFVSRNFRLNGAHYAIKQLRKFSGNLPNKFLYRNRQCPQTGKFRFTCLVFLWVPFRPLPA